MSNFNYGLFYSELEYNHPNPIELYKSLDEHTKRVVVCNLFGVSFTTPDDVFQERYRQKMREIDAGIAEQRGVLGNVKQWAQSSLIEQNENELSRLLNLRRVYETARDDYDTYAASQSSAPYNANTLSNRQNDAQSMNGCLGILMRLFGKR